MASDSEIQIIIRAIDEASATLKKIEGQVTNSNKSIQRTTENTGNAFTRTQGALLQLGQAAQSVHNIFETWQRKTIQVENAQDRLENATLRLKQANEDLIQATSKLIDIQKKHERDNLRLEDAQLSLEEAQIDLNEAIVQYGENSLEARRASLNLRNAQLDLADAQKLGTQKAEELSTAQKDLQQKQEALKTSENGVDIATRRLNKAIGDQKWAYVDMGVQMLVVAGQIPNLIKLFGGLTGVLGTTGVAGSASTATTAIAGAGGLTFALTALGAAMVAIPLAIHVNQLAEASEAYNTMSGAIDQTTSKIVDLDDQMKATTGMGGTRQTTVVPEPGYTLGNFNATTGQFDKIIEKEKDVSLGTTLWNEGLVGVFKKMGEVKDQGEKTYNGVIDMNNLTIAKMGQTNASIQGTINKLYEIPTTITTVHETIEIVSQGQSSGRSGSTSTTSKPAGGTFTQGGQTFSGKPNTPAPAPAKAPSVFDKIVGGVKSIFGFKDFVSRPGQAPVSFSSDDTIIGMKNPSDLMKGGKGETFYIYITGNNYGTDPDEISEAIMTKLRRKVSI